MPCARKNRYDKLKKSELKALLLQRDQSTTGSPNTSAARTAIFDNPQAVSNDDEFHFLKFPGEIRNEIYKLVADYVIERTDSRACLAIYSSDDWDWKKDKRLTLRGNPQLMILQPGLFLTCTQIYDEGLPFFYQRREFHLRLDHGKRILDLYPDQTGFSHWFQAIGDVGQQNIRHLTLRNVPAMTGIICMERIHRKLSDEATVVYQSETATFGRALWTRRARYQVKNKNKVPLFWGSNDLKCWDLDRNPGYVDLMYCKLIFKAGSGWFGMAQNDKAQIWWKSDKRIEECNEPERREIMEWEDLEAEEAAAQMEGASTMADQD